MLDAKVQTFLAVCETMNYTRAAEQLSLTQPAVSAHIHAMEEWYGTRLFSYEGKKLTLTPEGRKLRKAMTVMWNDQAKLRQQIAEPTEQRERISIGATRTIGEYIIARPLASFISKHPDADINMEIANTETLCNRIRAGEIRFALVEGSFDESEFDSLLYRTVPFVPVCAAGHVFADEPRVLADLLPERLILREQGSGTRNILERQLAAANLGVADFNSCIQISGMHTITELIAADTGISFLYRPAAEVYLSNGLLREIPLDDFHVRHDFRFIWQKGSIFAERYRQYCLEFGS